MLTTHHLNAVLYYFHRKVTGGEMEPTKSDLEKQITKAVSILKNGGVVAYPTDTVYGLGACMTDTTAVDRIFQVKGRPKGMALPVLLADSSQIREIVKTIPPAAQRLADEFFPGALTIILPKSDAVPEIITGGGTTVAYRIPNHPVPLALIKGLGKPIVGTSANLSGQPSALTAAEVQVQIGDKIDMVIDGGKCPGGIESTVIDLSGDRPVIRRQGAISIERLRIILPDIITS
jgi:L-threonylcarbamoyladenylate synthase